MFYIRFMLGALVGAALAALTLPSAAAAVPPGLYEQTEPLVVKVVSADGATGTGVRLYAPSGRIVILTNRHLCAHHIDGSLQVERAGETPEIVPILEVSRKTDLCVLAGGRAKRAMHVAPTYTYAEHVTLIGYPAGRLAVTDGSLVAREQFDDPYNDVFCATFPKKGCALHIYAVLTDAVAHPGSSGSPAINDEGEVVALVYAVSTLEDAPMTFAVALESVVSFLAKY